MKRNKGFTLIELLVVIAIIGILSSVVLASLNSARTKAKIASVQSVISSLRAQAEIGVVNGKYIANICESNDPGGLNVLLASIRIATAPTAQTSDVRCSQNAVDNTKQSTGWGAQATINGKTFCSDSTGFSSEITGATPGTLKTGYGISGAPDALGSGTTRVGSTQDIKCSN